MWDSETILVHGASTYAVLLGSWLCSCLLVESLARFGRVIQDGKYPPSPELKRQALKMAFGNWAWLAVAVVGAAPMLKVCMCA